MLSALRLENMPKQMTFVMALAVSIMVHLSNGTWCFEKALKTNCPMTDTRQEKDVTYPTIVYVANTFRFSSKTASLSSSVADSLN